MLADHDLNEIAGDATPLGWSRGLLLQGNTAFVGVTRIRRTKWRQNLSWIKHGFREPEGASPLPTRVVAFDLAARVKLGEWDLEDHISAVFSVLPATPPSARSLTPETGPV